MGHFHKWAYDEVTLTVLLESCGFASVDRMPYLTSRITDIGAVERRDDLIVEGVKHPAAGVPANVVASR